MSRIEQNLPEVASRFRRLELTAYSSCVLVRPIALDMLTPIDHRCARRCTAVLELRRRPTVSHASCPGPLLCDCALSRS